jgi:hypothetical protein
MGDLFNKPATQSAETKQPTAITPDDKPPTLLDLFKKDFPNTFKGSDEAAIYIKFKDGAESKIRTQVYMDFPAKAKFIGFYIALAAPPSADTSGEKTFTACLQLLEHDAVKEAFDRVSQSVNILEGQDGQMTSIQDLTFSGRVLIYHEEFLSIPQKADIIRAYAVKNLAVQFMGSDYLATQITAWYQQHNAKSAH